MAELNQAFSWFNTLRHQGLLISPVVLPEYFSPAGRVLSAYEYDRLRHNYTQFLARIQPADPGIPLSGEAVRTWLDYLMTGALGHASARWLKQDRLGDSYSARLSTGERIRPHRALISPDGKPLLLVWIDEARRLGIGRSKTQYARFLSLMRGAGVKLGLFTNGLQFRLCYCGLDHDAWVEWETEAWFAGSETRDQLGGFLSLLGSDSLTPNDRGFTPLLDAVEASRTRQGELAQVLGEQVRQAVELLLEGLPGVIDSRPDLVHALLGSGEAQLPEAERWRALYQGATRLIMRLVVVFYAEARDLLDRSNQFYHQSYSVGQLFANLQAERRQEPAEMKERRGAWQQLLSLFRLIYSGSPHPDLPIPAYGGHLFAGADTDSPDVVRRGLALFEASEYELTDNGVYEILKLLKMGKVRVRQGRAWKWVSGPVDFSDLRTEYIGIMYQGLLDYELRRVGQDLIVVLGIGSEPVLPLSLLEGLDPRGLKDLIQTLGKVEKSVEEEAEVNEEDQDQRESEDELVAESDEETDEDTPPHIIQTSRQRALVWAISAVEVAGLVKRPKRGEALLYDKQRERAAQALVKHTLEPGAFYLVRWGGTRKGSGTFYTRPQLSVPLTYRTLQPLCYDRLNDGSEKPKRPEEILGLKVCDPAMGSGSFLVAALNYLTDAMVASLHAHDRFRPEVGGTAVLLMGGPASGQEPDELVPCRPDDPRFDEMLRSRLKRHVVERCIYGVDINPLAVELARVSLWVEAMDRSLPFEFLDHKLKVGNSLVGCWHHRFEDYPVLAWARDGGDKQHQGVQFQKGVRTKRIKAVYQKQVVPELIETMMAKAFTGNWALKSLTTLRDRFFHMQNIRRNEAEREDYYRREIEGSTEYTRLREAMDCWCAVWFWPMDGSVEPLTPKRFEAPSEDTKAVVASLREKHRFFHWELEFPDVFRPDVAGFNAILGNPPWDIQKPNSLEFFSQFDPIYRTYGKQDAIKEQSRIYRDSTEAENGWLSYAGDFRALSNYVSYAAEPFELPSESEAGRQQLMDRWRETRRARPALVSHDVPFRHQGGADLNSYKLFMEMSWHLMAVGGRIGFVVPAGVYADKGSGALRRLFLGSGHWELLLAIVNERYVFESVHHSTRFAVVIISRGASTSQLSAVFRLTVKDAPTATELPNLIAGHGDDVIQLEVPWLAKLSGADLEVPSFRNKQDQFIFQKIFDRAVSVSEMLGRYPAVKFAREFDMTGDSPLFVKRTELERSGLLAPPEDVRDPRVRARLLREGFLPLYEGKHGNQFNPAAGGEHRYFIRVRDKRHETWEQVLWRSISYPTNSRTLISARFTAGCYGNSWWTIDGLSILMAKRLEAAFNSFVVDYVLRMIMPGANVVLGLVQGLPIPNLEDDLWHKAADLFTYLDVSGDPKSRLAARCWLDALVASYFNLHPKEFEHILLSFPAVDKRLPVDSRQTTLTSVAYRLLLTTGQVPHPNLLYESLRPGIDGHPGLPVWGPVDGWDRAWSEARTLLTETEWAMLTGSHRELAAPALERVAAAKQPVEGAVRQKQRNAAQIKFDLS